MISGVGLHSAHTHYLHIKHSNAHTHTEADIEHIHAHSQACTACLDPPKDIDYKGLWNAQETLCGTLMRGGIVNVKDYTEPIAN